SAGLPPFGAISRDGRSVLAWQQDDLPGISAIRADGGRTRLTEDARDVFPEWSPDGKWVAFWGNRPEGAGLFVVPAAGGPERLVGANAGGQAQPMSIVTSTLWPSAGGSDASIAFIQDRAVVTTRAEPGAAPVVVAGAADAETAAAALPSGPVADKIVLLDDGPDQ